VTSWVELRRDGLAALKHNFLHPDEQARVPYLTSKLADARGPVIASTDYVSEVPDQIRQFVPNAWATLGADEHGFSDTRAAARRYFHIDVHSIVVRALQELAAAGEVDVSAPKEAAERYQLLDVRAGTTGNAGGES
jgi:pyruvate dehydrogenase E1 component